MATDPARLWRKLSEPVDAASVVAFRIGFGVLMVIAVIRYFTHGWIAEYFLLPKYFFPHYGFGWAAPWPGAGMYVHFAVLGVLAVLVAAGAFYRASVLLFGAGFAYAHFIDKTIYLNHYYLVICLCLMMAALPLHRMASVDSRLRPTRRADTVPAWVLGALRVQVGLVYFFGGMAKLKPDWLLRAEPLKIWLPASADVPVVGRLFEQEWMAYAMGYAGALFDLTIVGFLLWRRSRPYAFAALVVFHLVTARLFQLGMFPWIMIASALVFFPPDWPRRLAARFGWPSAPPRSTTPRTSPNTASGTIAGQRFAFAAVAVHLALQLLLPLRQFAYPGNVNWTEQGFRFSWNVMLMEKTAVADFRVVEPSTGRTWSVVPTAYLTRYQAKMMSTQPDMILDFAHIVAADFRARGVESPAVYADVFASLNGRPSARLVDPNVDLSREEDGLGNKPWILPLETIDSSIATASRPDRHP